MVGLALHFGNPPTSRFHDLGTLLMIAWLPSVAWVAMLFARKRAPIVTPGGRLPHGTPYVAHAHAATQLTRPLAIRPGEPQREELSCLLLLGTEGFTARLWRIGNSASPAVNVQFLRPEVSVPRFGVGVEARVVVNGQPCGTLRMVDAPDA